jgi:hypothetical protein
MYRRLVVDHHGGGVFGGAGDRHDIEESERPVNEQRPMNGPVVLPRLHQGEAREPAAVPANTRISNYE